MWDATVTSKLEIYRVAKLVAMFCCITCKVLAAECADHQCELTKLWC